MTIIDTAFSTDGALAHVISGFTPRKAQTDMAVAVEKTIAAQGALVVEAGTGTGKTFAYIVPALLSGKKVIISTGTKTLQDQLFNKDLPLIRRAFASNVTTALLKGRANYLCQHRLELYRQSKGQLDSSQLAELVEVVTWSTTTKTGDVSELVNIADDAPIIPYVTSTVDNCLAKECPNIETCYLVKARQRAISSDIVVVNHHLFFADMALKDNGFGELIPEADVVIFDEAHQIPDVACDYFGQSFSTRQLVDLSSDVEQLYRTELSDMKQLSLAANQVKRQAQEIRIQFPVDPTRGHWRDAYRRPAVENQFNDMAKAVNFLLDVLKLAVGRSEEVDHCFERASLLLGRCQQMLTVEQAGVSLWYETTRKHLVLHQTPLSIADKFSDYVNRDKCAWVFTSATLAVNGSVEHFASKLGLNSCEQLVLDSPFDYKNQAMLVVPRYLPETNNLQRAQSIADVAKPLIEASQGQCFLLFTSYRIMHQVAEILEQQIDNTLLVQGLMPKSQLLQQFTQSVDSVLLATSSFWEGVDVKGQRLICVIIDKLPFAAPDDPLLQARSDDVKRQGGNPFNDIQLPQAIITLKQGVGRLIRDATDQGVMVICDSRLVNRAYGGLFMASLPPMKRTREISLATKFLQTINQPKENIT